MDKNEQGITIGTGGISILAIFVVLCLTTLATLSFVSARADYALANKTAQTSAEYYAADVAAEEKLAGVANAANGEGWVLAVEALGCAVHLEDNSAIIQYSEKINDTRTMDIEIRLVLDENGLPTGEFSREKWKTRVYVPEDEAPGFNVFSVIG